MNKKQNYTTPEVDIVQLQIEGAILSGSNQAGATGTGPNVTVEDGGIFDDIFN